MRASFTLLVRQFAAAKALLTADFKKLDDGGRLGGAPPEGAG
jgi:hypothetical protein